MTGHMRPFRRNVRQFNDGTYGNEYIEHQKFACDPDKYVRAFLIIQKDLQELFDFVEPSDSNKDCYSYRIHALIMRTCIEIEANYKAILLENNYKKEKARDLNIDDYRKINQSHRLSSYKVKVPYWHGVTDIRTPFAGWANGERLKWYDAYNATKHDRHNSFSQAALGNLLDAICGLVAILSSQFWIEDFGTSNSYLTLSGPRDNFVTAIGGYFQVKFPDDWPDDEKYSFSAYEWKEMKKETDPFKNLF